MHILSVCRAMTARAGIKSILHISQCLRWLCSSCSDDSYLPMHFYAQFNPILHLGHICMCASGIAAMKFSHVYQNFHLLTKCWPSIQTPQKNVIISLCFRVITVLAERQSIQRCTKLLSNHSHAAASNANAPREITCEKEKYPNSLSTVKRTEQT